MGKRHVIEERWVTLLDNWISFRGNIKQQTEVPFSLCLSFLSLFLEEADVNMEKYARGKIKTHEESEKLFSPSPK